MAACMHLAPNHRLGREKKNAGVEKRAAVARKGVTRFSASPQSEGRCYWVPVKAAEITAGTWFWMNGHIPQGVLAEDASPHL